MLKKILSILLVISAFTAQADAIRDLQQKAGGVIKDAKREAANFKADVKTLIERNKNVPQEAWDWLRRADQFQARANPNNEKLQAWTNTRWENTNKWTSEHQSALSKAYTDAVEKEKVREEKRLTEEALRPLSEEDKVDAGLDAYQKVRGDIDRLNGLTLTNPNLEEWMREWVGTFVTTLGDYRLTVADLKYLKNPSTQETVLDTLVNAALDREKSALESIAEKGTADVDVLYDADLYLIGFVCRNSELAIAKDKHQESVVAKLMKQNPKNITLIQVILESDKTGKAGLDVVEALKPKKKK